MILKESKDYEKTGATEPTYLLDYFRDVLKPRLLKYFENHADKNEIDFKLKAFLLENADAAENALSFIDYFYENFTRDFIGLFDVGYKNRPLGDLNNLFKNNVLFNAAEFEKRLNALRLFLFKLKDATETDFDFESRSPFPIQNEPSAVLNLKERLNEAQKAAPPTPPETLKAQAERENNQIKGL